ncbi:MAG: class I SAM-dependent methyltransferase [Pseudomonadota bacterium]
MSDPETLGFYDSQSHAYADCAADWADKALIWLDRFAATLPEAAYVLDFGAGSGWGAAWFRERGFSVRAIDGSVGLAAEARRRHGIEVEVAPFDTLDAEAEFDGAWVAFSLLHDTRSAFPGHLQRLSRALVPGGRLYLGLKCGEGSMRDTHGRRYTYFAPEEVRAALLGAGFSDIDITLDRGESFTGEAEDFLHTLATRRV